MEELKNQLFLISSVVPEEKAAAGGLTAPKHEASVGLRNVNSHLTGPFLPVTDLSVGRSALIDSRSGGGGGGAFHTCRNEPKCNKMAAARPAATDGPGKYLRLTFFANQCYLTAETPSWCTVHDSLARVA